MGWASRHIEQLRAGETVSFRPQGASMTGKINSGQLCTVAPIAPEDTIGVGDIVLCTVRGQQYLHLVKAVRGQQYLHLVKAVRGPQYQIGNNRGGTNGWVGRSQLHGRCIRIEQ